MRRTERARWGAVAILLAVTLVSGACQSTGLQPGDPIRLRVPMIRQGTGYTCGVAALQSILFHWGEEWREDRLARELGATPEEGTNYHAIVRLAESKGFRVEVSTGMTLDQVTTAVDAGWPVVVAIQAWGDHPEAYAESWDDGHYVVVVGHDRKNLYFMDPSTIGTYTFMPIESFLSRWHDYYHDADGQRVDVVHLGMIFRRDDPPTYDPRAIVPLE